MKRKGIFVLVVILLLGGRVIFAQSKEFRLIEGNCKAVIESLRESQGNDSIAVEVFKKEYKIDKMYNADNLLKKNYTEIIQYFDSEQGKNYNCRLKTFNSKIFPPVY
jgi:hypothetical protein